MAKKKLAFYDAFKSQPNEQESPDESGSQSIGHVAYTPGDELTLRPKPRNINTSYHSASSQNIEVRAKGSSIPPGAARQWQQPQVNKGYLKGDPSTYQTQSRQVPKAEPNLRPKVSNISVPDEEETNLDIRLPPEPEQELEASRPKNASRPMAKPVSFQSETLPYLDESDLETKNIPLSKSHSTQTRPSQQNESFGEAIHLSPKAAISLIVLWVASILFTAMITRYASSPNENSADMREITSVPKDETPSTITQKSRMDETIDVTRIVDGGTGTATATNRREQPVVQPEVPVDNARKIYTIRTVTIGDENTAKAFVTSLEEDGFRPARISRTTRGILITVGEFASVNEAQPMLEKLKNKTLNHRKPFRDAYVAKR